ncbi:MAG: type II methionyl aminopeptidase [Candidatus Hydrothermarchaeota archaeon]|nr:MAG: type II methionyl aminopeptidase [Candidatus Hydrothermarchaeota archaeon]
MSRVSIGNTQDLSSYLKTGEIAKSIKKELEKIIRPKVKLLKIAKFVESKATPAFPCNLCLNEIISFYTPPEGDTSSFDVGDVLKIDFGIRLGDYIVDNALTTAFHKSELIEVCEEALKKAIEVIKPGVTTCEIGAKIQETIESQGFKTFKELYGHSISKGTLHSFLTIPNVATEHGEKIRTGEVLAIEVFVTSGKGEIDALKKAYIYRFVKPVESRLFKRYRYYPFAERWLSDKEKEELSILIKAGKVYPLCLIVEKSDAKVAHFEDTVVVTKRGCKVIT